MRLRSPATDLPSPAGIVAATNTYCRVQVLLQMQYGAAQHKAWLIAKGIKLRQQCLRMWQDMALKYSHPLSAVSPGISTEDLHVLM